MENWPQTKGLGTFDGLRKMSTSSGLCHRARRCRESSEGAKVWIGVSAVGPFWIAGSLGQVANEKAVASRRVTALRNDRGFCRVVSDDGAPTELGVLFLGCS